MESFFFNITDRGYKAIKEHESDKGYIKRVDVSNGIVFYDISLDFRDLYKSFDVKNLDRAIAIVVSKKGNIIFNDNITNKTFKIKENSIAIFESTKQDITFKINEKVKIFAIFIADYILKRYLDEDKNEVINFLYDKLQGNLSCALIDQHPTDALSLYIMDKILDIDNQNSMKSIKCECNILEFMIYRFSLIDMPNDTLDENEKKIAKKAKDILLKSYTNPYDIKTLAHLCATNETKIKLVFKKAYKTTIYKYIQKLRLEKANYLLMDKHLCVAEVAKAVGYKHQGNFSKLFFKYYGVYPKDLLKIPQMLK
jgi:AraC-like DNA-binding protein